MSTENKEEPTNSDIMAKLVKIEEEVGKAEKRLYNKITWSITFLLIVAMVGFVYGFTGW